MKQINKKMILISIFSGCLLFFAGCSMDAKSKLNKLKKASSCPDTELRDNGKSISGDYREWDLDGLMCVLDAVEFPDWARSDLQSTRPIDGRKTAEWNGFIASWSYDSKEISMTVRIK